jgi:hypothetical protein
MFCRGEEIGCGTTTTGTGTLTLAAAPVPPGLVDPVAAWGTSGAYPVAYTIIEYTTSGFSTVHQFEKGYGTLTLASSLSSATLSRTPTVTGTSLDSQPATYANNAPSAITIGTAANVLVFVGSNAAEDSIQALPNGFYSTSGITSADGLGVAPFQGSSTGSTASLTNATAYFQRVLLGTSGPIRSVSVRVTGAVTSPTSNSFSAALFEVASNGLPGKRLINFGTNNGTTAAPLGTTGNVTVTALSAVNIPAGFYFLGILPAWGGGSGNPTLRAAVSVAPSPLGTAFGQNGGNQAVASVASGNLSDPPSTTSIALASAFFGTGAGEFACAFRST